MHGPAEIAKVGRRSHYDWIRDAEYAAMFQEAKEQAADHLECEARRRAVEGVEEPVYYKGEVCGTIRKYSDLLLIFLLNGARPEKYRDKAPSTQVNVQANTYGTLDAPRQAELDRLRSIVAVSPMPALDSGKP